MRSEALAFSTGSPSIHEDGRSRPGLGHAPLIGLVFLLSALLPLAFTVNAASAAAPTVSATAASVVTAKTALLEADLNPGGEATTFRFEYGSADCSLNPCQSTAALAGNVGSGAADVRVKRELTGLAPNTTYHFRVVATNGSGPAEGPDRSFTTHPASSGSTDCPNEDARIGPSADLPDCRAYEMVSPVDKSGADIVQSANALGFLMGSEQAARDGERVTFSSYKPFGDAKGSLWTNQFMATRGADGWDTHSINPPHANNNQPFFEFGFVPGRYSAFTEDLSKGFLYDDAKPAVTPEALAGYNNSYLRDSGTGAYETLTTQLFGPASPPLGGMGFMGYSDDDEHTVFAAQAALTSDALANTSIQLYDYHDGELELVSVLPNEQPSPNSTAGNAGQEFGGSAGYNVEGGETHNAVSDDGSRIFWMTDFAPSSNVGKLYVRIDGERTVAVSESVSPSNSATYWSAANDGSAVVFSLGTDLYRFDVDTETPTPVAGAVNSTKGVLGVSEDASRIYFLSKEALGPGAEAGEPNLYLDEDGAKTFIATLAEEDEIGPGSTAGNGSTINGSEVTSDFSQVTPSGRHVVFNSRATLTSYDNTSVQTGDPAIEIYTYDAVEEELLCVSCNPDGTRPETKRLPIPHELEDETAFFDAQAAAWLPTPRRGTYRPRMVADDGGRIFFNAFDALVPQDSNGAQDVYQWVRNGVGGCARAAGCVSLISRGTSPAGAIFVDASEDGRDVFFRTGASLVPEDLGLIDMYTARIGGGFAPDEPPPPCVGDACQNIPAAPQVATPASASFRGAGDKTSKAARRGCRARKTQAKKKGAKAGKQRSKKAGKQRKCRRNQGAGRRTSR